ncbi:hypothetical protein NHQ30_001916 [Ciborinia camelliae]|nr:hypothetical protein NHQ30_001916 [Ciborinia camelliae]
MAATSTLNESSLDRDSVTKTQFETVIRKLLQDISYKPRLLSRDLILEKFVLEYFLELGRLQHLDLQKITQISKLTVDATLLLYMWHDKEPQKIIALYLGYFYIIDDYAHDLLPNLRAFRRNLLAGKSNGPLLDELVRFLVQFDDCYGSFTADFIFSGTLEFITVAVFECEMEGKLQCHPDAPDFPRYFRSKTAIAEAFIKFLWPEKSFPEATCLQHCLQATPDLTEITGMINDTLSFYKESIVSTERNNYVYNYAAAHGITAHKALEIVAGSLMECVRRLRSLFCSEPEMLKVMNGYVGGIFAMHALPRYRLSECDLPELLRQS